MRRLDKIYDKVGELYDSAMNDSRGYKRNYWHGMLAAYDLVFAVIASVRRDSTLSAWHDASEEPKDMSHCLICYKAGDKVTYMDIIPVLYNKDTKEFVSHSYPHATDSKIEYGSIEGHGLVDVYKNMRDRFPLADIDKWAYIEDLLKL